MKKTLITTITLLLCIVLFAALVLTGCGKDDEDVAAPSNGGESVSDANTDGDKSGIDFKTLSVDGTAVSGKVSNATTVFDFSDEITVSGDATYKVTSDAEGTQTVNEASLSEGDNVFYVHMTIDGSTTVYTVKIYRRHMYTVVFDTNGGTAVESQTVEEDSVVTVPTTTRTCYTLAGWDHDLTQPITKDMTVTAKWEVAPEMRDFYFKITANECTITGVKDKTKTSYVIPDYVTSIGSSAFNGCSRLMSVTIGNSVTSIGDSAFYDCTHLTSITIPDSVTSIGYYAFYDCYNLTSVTIGNSVTSIGDMAFYKCYSLTSVSIGKGVESIGSSAFEFEYCYKLVEVINHSSLDIEAGSSDYGGIAYFAIEVHTETSSKIVNKNDYLFYTYNGVNYLLGYAGIDTKLVLPNDYNGDNYEIYNYAFYNRDDITSVTIPDSVTSIGVCAFYNCYKLVEVINHSSLTFTAGSSDYGNIASYAKEVHTGTSKIVNKNDYLFYTYEGTNYLLGYVGTDTVLVLPEDYNGNYEIYQYAFYDRDDITSVTIPDSVTSIGYEAFYNCTGLTSVSVGNGVMSIGDSAFEDCKSLTSVSVGNNVTSIGSSAFEYCLKLVEVINNSSLYIKAGISYNGYIAYYAEEVHTGTSKIVNKDDYLFYTYNGVNYLLGYAGTDTELVLPNDYNGKNYEIYQYAFYERDDIKSVTIPDSVTGIGDSAFEDCKSLTSVSIGNSVKSIGLWAFDDCTSLTSVYIDDIAAWCNISFVNSNANPLYYAKNLYLKNASGEYKLVTNLVIPDSVTSIGNYAFYGCTGLTSVTFENTSGWWYSSDSTATSGTSISSSDLANTSTAATYLNSTYCAYYWKRG